MTIYTSLSDAELIAEMKHQSETPDPKLVEEIIGRQESLAPHLLSIFDALSTYVADDAVWRQSVLAGRILLHWREPAALPTFAKIYSRGEDECEWFEEKPALYGPQAISTFGDVALSEPREGWHYGRALATSVLAAIAHRYPETRDDVITALRSVLPGLQADGSLDWPAERGPDEVWSSVVSDLAELKDVESQDVIMALFDADMIDESVIDRATYRGLLSGVGRKMPRPREYDLMDEVRRDRELEQARQQRLAREAQRLPVRRAPLPGTRPKVGRNEPCPCGSGKKYKQCCGKK